MADTGIFATTAEVQALAGANCSATYNAESYINTYMTMAESYINAATRINWSDSFVALNVDVKGALKMAAACLAAIFVINSDLSGFPVGSIEAQTRIDVLRDWFTNAMKILEESAAKDFVRTA